MGALGLEFLAHGHAPVVHHLLVPSGSDGNTSGEDTGIVGHADGQGTILKTEAVEAKAWNASDVANTRSR